MQKHEKKRKRQKTSNENKNGRILVDDGSFIDMGVREASTSVAELFSLLKNIGTTPERITQNQWKSISENGKIEFYY